MLKNHPFPVKAFFDTSVVLTYAVPVASLRHLIPDKLQLDTLNNTWAFIAVALVDTKDLRPSFFPRFLGNNFFLVGYRIFVRYQTVGGKNLRGLYILRSETDSRLMQLLGNLLTHYKYSKVVIRSAWNQAVYSVSSSEGLDIRISAGSENIPLPGQSPFADWKEARRFAGPLPFTFSYNESLKEMAIVEGVRSGWLPEPVQVISARLPYVDSLKLDGVALANAFIIRQIPYAWKKGVIEKWK